MPQNCQHLLPRTGARDAHANAREAIGEEVARVKAASPLQLAALCTVPFIMVLGNSMLIPVLPELRQALHVGKPQAGLMITAFSIPAAAVIAVAGFFSDRYGRKLIMVPGILLYAFGGLVAGTAAWLLRDRAFWLIIAGRVIQGLGAAGTAPIAMATVGDLFRPSERTRPLGLLEAANGAGKVVSPILGSLIGLLVWWAVFYGFAILAVLAAAAVWFGVKEPDFEKAKGSVGEYMKQVRAVFRKQGVGLSAAIWCGTVALFVLFGILFFLSEHLESRYGMDGIPKGLVLAIPLGAMAVTSYFTGAYLQNHLGLTKPAVVAGFSLGAAGLLLIPLVRADWFFFVGITLLGFGTGLVLPGLNTLITSAADSNERGMITAVYGAVRFFGVAMGPPLYGWLMGKGKFAPFWFSAVLVGATAAVALFFVRPLRAPGAGDRGAGDERRDEKAAGPQRWTPPEDLPAGTRRPVRP